MAHHYHVVISKRPDGHSYIAEVPDLAGCVAFGETLEAVTGNAKLAIDAWLDAARAEGREIPAPKTIFFKTFTNPN
jgi:predicted RNase H-like HicB family nuclease